MAKVITFSRYFPPHHARAGEPTYFVEKVWKSLFETRQLDGVNEREYQSAFPCQFTEAENIHNHKPKHHTIRAGHRWKAGDKASLRVWKDKPYRSKQIEFAEVEIKKVWDFEIKPHKYGFDVLLNHLWFAGELQLIAKNDGLEYGDFISWFGLDKEKTKPFVGQIICWSDEVNYY